MNLGFSGVFSLLAATLAFVCATPAWSQGRTMSVEAVVAQGTVNGHTVQIEALVVAPAGTEAKALSAGAARGARLAGDVVFSTLTSDWATFQPIRHLLLRASPQLIAK
jgi:hypothetical protein